MTDFLIWAPGDDHSIGVFFWSTSSRIYGENSPGLDAQNGILQLSTQFNATHSSS